MSKANIFCACDTRSKATMYHLRKIKNTTEPYMGPVASDGFM
jgi:hypothetical protein